MIHSKTAKCCAKHIIALKGIDSLLLSLFPDFGSVWGESAIWGKKIFFKKNPY